MAERLTHATGAMNRIGRTRLAAVMGLYALLLELFFGAVHAAALATTAFGPPRDPGSFIFRICTPAGLASLSPAGADAQAPDSRKAASDFCPVCGTATVSPFTFAPQTILPAPRLACLRMTGLRRMALHKPAPHGARRIRSPPAA